MDDIKKLSEDMKESLRLSNLSLAFRQNNLPKMHSMVEVLADANEPYTARSLFEQLKNSIMLFEKSLDAEQEVGVRLVNFGNTVQFSVSRIGYMNPCLIWFEGMLPDGSTTKLIQHTSQISFLLMSMKRDTGAPKRPIGFCTPQGDGE